MATYIHGKSAALLHGAYDISPWITEMASTQTIQPADTSHFGSNSKTYIVGQDDGTGTFSGLYDGTQSLTFPNGTTGINQIMMNAIAAEEAAAGGNTATPVTFGMEGISVGAACVLGGAKHTSYKITTVITDVNKIDGDIQFTGGVKGGYFLQSEAPMTTTFTGTALDNGVTPGATTKGARAHLHVLANANTGNVTAKIQHSTDNSTWVDLQSFTIVPTITLASEWITIAPQTINRYVRTLITLAGTGSVTAPVAFARH